MELIKILGQSCPQTESVVLYEVPFNKGCVVSYLNICNMDGNDANISIMIGNRDALEYVPSDPKYYVEYQMLVYANCSSQRLKGVTLSAGDAIMVISNTDTVSFNLFGSEFTQNYNYAEAVG